MHQKVLDLSAGLGSDGWRRKQTVSSPQYYRPGPAIANLTRHDAHDHVSRRRDASGAGTEKESPKTTSQRQAPAPGPQPPAPSKTSDSTSRQSQARQESFFFVWPDIPLTWEVERDARATQKPGHSFKDLTSPVLVGLSAPRRWLSLTQCLARENPNGPTRKLQAYFAGPIPGSLKTQCRSPVRNR